jgi:hypothetical protein
MANNIVIENAIELEDAPLLISTVGAELSVILKGEPGIGKSSVLKMLEEMHGDKYDYIYVDCPVLDLSDIVMRIPNHESKSLESYVSSLFRLDSPKPKIIMLDEFSKTNKLLQTMFTRLLLEHCVGDVDLNKTHPETIIFGTGNHTKDGVGDSMLAHAGNRVMIVPVKKPNAMKFNIWASVNGISRSIRGWVAMNPKALASWYDGGQDDNEFILRPGNNQLSFVSNRSLAKVDVVVRNASKFNDRTFKAALAGTCGIAFANSFDAFMKMEKELVSVKSVIADPDNIPMPEKPAVLFMMMFNAVDTIETQDDLSNFMKFVNRIKNEEVQECFFTMALKGRISRLASMNASIKAWGVKNLELMM